MFDQPSAQSGETTCLIDLPPDIHSLIIEQLRTDESAAVPRYQEEYGSDHLQRKSKEFYGEATDDDIARAEGLRNWSKTCWYFQRLVAPHIFRIAVLRTTSKSMRSIQTLSQTKYWSNVRSFIFVNTGVRAEDDDDDDAEEWEGETDEEIERNMNDSKRQNIEAEMVQLAGILSNLPPNLRSLTLDFPREWDSEYSWEIFQDHHFFHDQTDERLIQSEKLDRYRALLCMAFEAILKNDISNKLDFELRLHNVPSLRCSALENRRLAPFLRHVTSFTFGACQYDDDAGGRMSTGEATYLFGERLGSWLFDHLDNVKAFNFHADESWPFGNPEWYPIHLRLPATSRKMSKIERISIKQVFVCPELVEFLAGHAATIVSVEMTDCYAATDSLGDDGLQLDEEVPTWSSLFTALTEAKPPNLIFFTIDNSSEILQQIMCEDGRPPSEDVVRAKEVLQNQAEAAVEACGNGARMLDVKRRWRKLLPYCTLDTEYGTVIDGKEESILRFNNKIDFEAWLKLVDIIEENAGRKDDRIVDIEPA